MGKVEWNDRRPAPRVIILLWSSSLRICQSTPEWSSVFLHATENYSGISYRVSQVRRLWFSFTSKDSWLPPSYSVKILECGRLGCGGTMPAQKTRCYGWDNHWTWSWIIKYMVRKHAVLFPFGLPGFLALIVNLLYYSTSVICCA